MDKSNRDSRLCPAAVVSHLAAVLAEKSSRYRELTAKVVDAYDHGSGWAVREELEELILIGQELCEASSLMHDFIHLGGVVTASIAAQTTELDEANFKRLAASIAERRNAITTNVLALAQAHGAERVDLSPKTRNCKSN